MATPNRFLKMFFLNNKKNESCLFKWETHNSQKCGVHIMVDANAIIVIKFYSNFDIPHFKDNIDSCFLVFNLFNEKHFILRL